MSDTFDADVRAALRGGVAVGVTGFIDTKKQWGIEASDFSPDVSVPWVRDTLNVGDSKCVTIPAQRGITRADGTYLIDVFLRDGRGSGEADRCVAQLRRAFAVGTSVSANGQIVYIRRFKRAFGVVTGKMLMTPITVTFFTYNTNP